MLFKMILIMLLYSCSIDLSAYKSNGVGVYSMWSADNSNHDGDVIALERLLENYHGAMVAADTAVLNTLLLDNFSLIHITGYRQQKAEWFEVIETGQFDYHWIEIEASQLSIKSDGENATIAGRGIFHATINGMNRPWRLQFVINFQKREAQWKVLRSSYKSF